MRRNVLAWLTGRVPDARQAIVLTHNVDLLFVQAVLASKLKQSGHPRLTVFADAMSAGRTYTEQRELLDGLGVRFRVVPVDLGPGRRFHPKALLLAGPDGAALALGSGNLTHGGMAANHEAWTFAVPGGESAGLLSAFRGYLEQLVATLPLADALDREVADAFSPERAWVRTLPAPSGLAASPGAEPMLAQIAQMAGDGVRSVDVLAPYHDDEGAALAAIAVRFAGPVTCWLQRGREGLSKGAAARLPRNVTLASVDCAGGRPASFIHAKVIAFRRDADVVVAIGSANCSRAALTLPGTAANAELMAVAPVAHAEWETFIEGLARGGDPPSLPDEPPSADWESDTPHQFRVLAARRTGDRLDVAFRAPGALLDLTIEADGMSWPALGVPVANAVSFGPVERVAAIVLAARDHSGARVASPPFWVDDEDSLGLPASVRRFAGQLGQSAGEPMGPDEFRAVLELFRDYLTDPETANPRERRGDRADAPPLPYDPAEVFSDGFGRAPIVLPALGAATDASILSIVESLFSLPGPARTPDRHPPSPEEPEAAEEGELPPEPEAVEPPRRNAASGTSARLLQTVAAVSEALRRPAAAERSPRALGTGIALAAVLLVKGRADGLLDPANYREITRTLWRHLFFGHDGALGSVPGRLGRAPDAAARNAIVAAMVDPRLSAALALWSMTEWRAEDAEAAWFRLSAALLHQREPWLFAGAPAGALADEISRMAEALLPPGGAERAVRTWAEVVQAGESVRAICAALALLTPSNLLSRVSGATVGEGELVWVQVSMGSGKTAAGRLGRNVRTVRREPKVKASVVLLGEADARSYMAASLVPVREVVAAKVMDVPAGVSKAVLALAAGVALPAARERPPLAAILG
jgi:hypothetical protein